MKNNERTTPVGNRCGSLLVVLFVGMSGVFLQRSEAASNDGKESAVENGVAVKRDPFWPVDHVVKGEENSALTQKKQGVSGAVDWDKAMKQVVINGVSSRADNEYVAVINNEVKSVGESVSIRYGGAKYTWKVEKITPPGSVKLRRHLVE